MKKIALLMLLFPSLMLAQGKFTEATLADFNKKLKASPEATIKKYTHKDFSFISGIGTRVGYNELLANYTYNVEPLREMTELKISQVGNTASVSGKVHHIIHPKGEPTKLNDYTGMFTYTYVYDGGTWKIITAQHSNIAPKPENEEATIWAVIKTETDGYYEGNPTKQLSVWSGKATDEYQAVAIIPFVKTSYAIGPVFEQIKSLLKQMNTKPIKADVQMTEKQLSINGNLAWATYSQKVMVEGKQYQNARQTRILEKIDGIWKLVFVGQLDIP
jgi:ketosteroid isomerase-like protein